MSTGRGESAGEGGSERLDRLFQSLQGIPSEKPRPVERWHPPYCGEIDLVIRADGTWLYRGTAIERPALVKLFASILRKDGERYVLVTPVECVGISVEDVPFLAVEMAEEAGVLHFRTNVDDVVAAGVDHPLRFEVGTDGGFRPCVHVRAALWARLTRPLAYELAGRAEEREVDGRPVAGIASGEAFFPLPTGDEVRP